MPAAQTYLGDISKVFFTEMNKLKELETSIFLKVLSNLRPENEEGITFLLLRKSAFHPEFLYNFLKEELEVGSEEFNYAVERTLVNKEALIKFDAFQYYTGYENEVINNVIVSYVGFLYKEFLKMLTNYENTFVAGIVNESFRNPIENY